MSDIHRIRHEHVFDVMPSSLQINNVSFCFVCVERKGIKNMLHIVGQLVYISSPILVMP